MRTRVLSTDLALAPWGWHQAQARVRTEELEPALARSDLRLFPARFPRRLGFSPGLRRAARQMAPAFDVMHIHNLWQFPQYAGYRAALDAGVPYVVSLHGSLDPYLRRHGRVRKHISSALWHDDMLARAAAIHVTTPAEERLTADIAPHVARVVVPCGISAEDFANPPPRQVFRQRRLGGYDGPLILFLGRITKKKGLEVLIRAFAEVRRARECRLAVVGPDDERLMPSLTRLVQALGVGEDITFLEPVYGDERLAALASADVWALSSHAENFGIAVVEAMAAGCAVVISQEVNVSEAVQAGAAGIVAPAEPGAFAAALLEILGDDELRARLGRDAVPFARRYDWAVVAPQLERMYRGAADPAATQ